MVINYRNLNEKTISNAYPRHPPPNICDILNQLGGTKYFSVLNLVNEFSQMDLADTHKIAFSMPHGNFQFERMPFGLKNAPVTFQRLIDQMLAELQSSLSTWTISCFMPISFGISKIEKLMELLWQANFKLQPDKCDSYFTGILDSVDEMGNESRTNALQLE